MTISFKRDRRARRNSRGIGQRDSTWRRSRPGFDTATRQSNSTPALLARSRMRVSILTYAPSGWGGTEVNTLGFARALAAKGHAVTLVQLGHDVYRERLDPGDGVALHDVELSAP